MTVYILKTEGTFKNGVYNEFRAGYGDGDNDYDAIFLDWTFYKKFEQEKEHHLSIYKKDYDPDWEKHITKKSQHLYGKAADIKKVSGLTVDGMAVLAEQVGFDGIGKYSWGIHLDLFHFCF